MFRIIVICCFFVSSSFAGLFPVRNGRIVGGREALPGQFPYQASLRTASSNSHFCGGAVISSRWLVSAAHCTSGRSASGMTAVLGAFSRTSGGVPYSISTIINHPAYDRHSMHYDVSVLQTASTIDFGSGVAQIRLASRFYGSGITAIVTGWGQTSDPGSPSATLQWIDLSTITNDACRSGLAGTGTANNIHDTNICTTSSMNRGTCMGDSGGPLVANGELIGIVSWGIPCARGRPDVFVRVDNVRDWILMVAR